MSCQYSFILLILLHKYGRMYLLYFSLLSFSPILFLKMKNDLKKRTFQERQENLYSPLCRNVNEYERVLFFICNCCKVMTTTISECSPVQWFSSVQFSRSMVSDSLRPHELQHARPPCPSPTPEVHSHSRPLSQ